MEAADPAPDGGVDVQVDHGAKIALPRIGKLEPAVHSVARYLPVAQGNQLADLLIQKQVTAVAGHMRR